MFYKNINNLLKDEGIILKHYKSVNSTMDKIKKLITNSKDQFLVVSDEQYKGKGRRGTTWYSPKGNLYFSFCLRMFLDIEKHYLFNILASLSISEIIENICKIQTKIKWPNDVMINKKKISGIITELYKFESNYFIIIGIGINTESAPDIYNYPTVCLKEIKSKINNSEVLELFIKSFFNKKNYIESKNYNYILEKYKKKLLYLNDLISLKIDNSFLTGKFEDINLDGSILINVDGKRKNIYSARIINDIN